MLASGSGTILEAMLVDEIPVALVGVDRSCRATRVANDASIEWFELTRTFDKGFDRTAFSKALADRLLGDGIDLVVMAGFGTILAQPMYDHFAGRILNTHPALLPSFPGWHAVRDAIDHGVKVTGCTVHVAELTVDAGPILAQEAVAVAADDTVESLHERIKVVERRLYVDTIAAILARGWVIQE